MLHDAKILIFLLLLLPYRFFFFFFLLLLSSSFLFSSNFSVAPCNRDYYLGTSCNPHCIIGHTIIGVHEVPIRLLEMTADMREMP